MLSLNTTRIEFSTTGSGTLYTLTRPNGFPSCKVRTFEAEQGNKRLIAEVEDSRGVQIVLAHEAYAIVQAWMEVCRLVRQA